MKAILIFYCLMALIVIFSATYYHELAHVQINEKLGCENSTIGISPLGMYTSAYCERTPLLIELHAQNEIVGYNSYGIMMMIFVLGLIIILVMYDG